MRPSGFDVCGLAGSMPRGSLPRGAAGRGISLIEVAIAIAVIGTTLIAVAEATFNLDRMTGNARDKRLAALLANQIMTRECLGSFPETVGETTGVSQEPVDVELYGNDYRYMTYSVEKSVQELQKDSDPTQTDEQGRILPPEEDPTAPEDPDAEPVPVAQVVRIKVTVHYRHYNFQSQATEDTEFVIETFTRNRRKPDAEGEQPGAAGGSPGAGGLPGAGGSP